MCVLMSSYPCFPNNLDAIFLRSSFSTSSDVSLLSTLIEPDVVETNPELQFRPGLIVDFSSDDVINNNCPASFPLVDTSVALLLS